MKRTILLLFVLLTVASCIGDDRDGCPANMSLVFTHGDNGSVEEFDAEIGNDVQLQIYENNIFYNTLKIPYVSIRGGKPYTFLKEFAGDLNFVAWAVNRDGDNSLIPSNGTDPANVFYTLEEVKGTEENHYKPSLERLYLGTLETREAVEVESTHEIRMKNIFCQVTVIIAEADEFAAIYPGNPSARILGTAGTMNVADRKPIGPEATIHAEFTEYGAENLLRTPAMGVLPSYQPGATILVELYTDDRVCMYVDSQVESVSGGEVTIIIYPNNLFAEVIVNGWTYKVQTVSP